MIHVQLDWLEPFKIKANPVISAYNSSKNIANRLKTIAAISTVGDSYNLQ